MRHSVIPRAEG